MQIRHEELLTSRLEEAALLGWAHIRWEEMYLWYGVQKIGAGTWRDLVRRWERVIESVKATGQPNPWSDPGKLQRVESNAGMLILGDKWMKPVES